MGNFNDREPDETYYFDDDMLLYDVITRTRRTAEPGDMIQYHRGGYEHWAIYVENDRVIQVTVEDFGNTFYNISKSMTLMGSSFGRETAPASITEESFNDVLLPDRAARINNFKDGQWAALLPNDIVANARRRIGIYHYNVLSNNCEHFATECRYGRRLSGQEEAFWSTITLGIYQRQ